MSYPSIFPGKACGCNAIPPFKHISRYALDHRLAKHLSNKCRLPLCLIQELASLVSQSRELEWNKERLIAHTKTVDQSSLVTPSLLSVPLEKALKHAGNRRRIVEYILTLETKRRVI